ncbi:MAG: hypothetical protein ACOC90_10520 [Bacteroidota bacterium]
MTKASRLLIRSAYVAALGGFLFGFDTAVISGAEKSIQEFLLPHAGLSLKANLIKPVIY